MPTIAEAAQQLIADGVSVLFLDTCILLDVIRAPLRRLPGCIESALAINEFHAQSSCRIIASSMIPIEWGHHERSVSDEIDRHLEARDQDALAFHNACDQFNISLAFGKPSYQAAGLVDKLRDLASQLLNKAIHLSPSDESKTRATDRLLVANPPARRGSGPQDCIIIEEYLELCRRLQAEGFSSNKVFCTSNTKDYQVGPKMHGSLANEFAAVGLTYTNGLHWAVRELRRPQSLANKATLERQ